MGELAASGTTLGSRASDWEPWRRDLSMLKKSHLYLSALVLIAAGFGQARAQTAPNATNKSRTSGSKAVQPFAATTPVVGGGTSGQLPKWVGTDGLSFTLGNSI